MTTKVIILFFWIAATISFAFGQDSTKAQLVDEFGIINYDDLLARVDNFFMQLHNLPGAKGIFRITGNDSEIAKMLYREQTLRGAIEQRGHNTKLITFLRGTSDEQFTAQFWLIPEKVTRPDLKVVKISAKLPRNFSPFNIRNDMSQICDPEPLEPLTTELLRENPEGHIVVVINYESSRERSRQLNEAIKMLHIYPRSHVRFLLRKSGTGWNDYWFVYGRPTKTAFYRRLKLAESWSY